MPDVLLSIPEVSLKLVDDCYFGYSISSIINSRKMYTNPKYCDKKQQR